MTIGEAPMVNFLLIKKRVDVYNGEERQGRRRYEMQIVQLLLVC
jgi:hypothetical protein